VRVEEVFCVPGGGEAELFSADYEFHVFSEDLMIGATLGYLINHVDIKVHCSSSIGSPFYRGMGANQASPFRTLSLGARLSSRKIAFLNPQLITIFGDRLVTASTTSLALDL
jgi:hypothetical protein